MPDRQDTISNLETNIRWIEDHEQHQFPGWGNVTMAMRDAAELLKEQEPVEPTVGGAEEYDGHGSWWYQCGKCKMPIDYGERFCRWCGMRVKWE